MEEAEAQGNKAVQETSKVRGGCFLWWEFIKLLAINLELSTLNAIDIFIYN